MAQFESEQDNLGEAGAQLVYIAAEKQNGTFLAMLATTGMWQYSAGDYLRTHPVSYPFLMDEDRKVTKAYGVHHAFGMDAINIAHPATFVIDREGIVRYAYVSENQFDRAPMGELMKAVREL